MNRILFDLVHNEFRSGLVESMIVDGESLASLVARSAPTSGYNGLVSALLPPRETLMSAEDSALIRSRILPPEGGVAIAPILICPDDLDLSCTVIFAQVERAGDTVTWRQLGVEARHSEVRSVGALAVIKREGKLTDTMDWWPGVGPFSFSLEEYRACLTAFERAAAENPS